MSDYADIRKDFAECVLQPGGVYLIVQPQLRRGMLALRGADGDGALLPHVRAICLQVRQAAPQRKKLVFDLDVSAMDFPAVVHMFEIWRLSTLRFDPMISSFDIFSTELPEVTDVFSLASREALLRRTWKLSVPMQSDVQGCYAVGDAVRVVDRRRRSR